MISESLRPDYGKVEVENIAAKLSATFAMTQRSRDVARHRVSTRNIKIRLFYFILCLLLSSSKEDIVYLK